MFSKFFITLFGNIINGFSVFQWPPCITLVPDELILRITTDYPQFSFVCIPCFSKLAFCRIDQGTCCNEATISRNFSDKRWPAVESLSDYYFVNTDCDMTSGGLHDNPRFCLRTIACFVGVLTLIFFLFLFFFGHRSRIIAWKIFNESRKNRSLARVTSYCANNQGDNLGGKFKCEFSRFFGNVKKNIDKIY